MTHRSVTPGQVASGYDLPAMSLPRLIQLVGLLLVTWVMVSSYLQEPSMLFQFGGLALGALVFWLGISLQDKRD